MRFIRAFFVLIVFICLPVVSASAATTSGSSNGFTVKATDNSTGWWNSGVNFSLSFNVPGSYPKGAWVILTVCDKNHKPLKVNNKQVWVYKPLNLPYKNNSFKNVNLVLPYSELKKANISNTGSFTYFVTVQSKHNNATIKQSGFLNWGGSGSSGSNNNKSNVVKKWTEKGGNMTIHHTLYSDGTETLVVEQPCLFCNHTGLCRACAGSGIISYPNLQIYSPCTMCNRNGKCTVCKGKKVEYHLMIHKPDGLWFDGSGKLIAPPVKDDHKGPDHGCSVCGGSGVQRGEMYVDDPAGAQANVIAVHMLGYQNLKGNTCPYCGDYNYHVHVKCYKCR